MFLLAQHPVAAPSKTVLTGNISVTSSITVAASVPLAGSDAAPGVHHSTTAGGQQRIETPTLGRDLDLYRLHGWRNGDRCRTVRLFNGSLYTRRALTRQASLPHPHCHLYSDFLSPTHPNRTASLTLVAQYSSLAALPRIF